MKAGELIDLLMHYSDDNEIKIEVYETISGHYVDTTADIAIVEDAYADPKLHLDRLKSYALTAQNRHPRRWSDTGAMVHLFRRNGAWRPQAWCTGPPCGKLLRDTLAFAHGFALDLDGIGVIDDPVTDSVGQGWGVQILVLFAGVVL